jgi:pyruvate ferredoxin oxidoreductase gamma subunit/2-oxoisovalerate ferredoxin oxidoreductase gamma subunit
VATLDATAIAVNNRLGTRALPIVNTALLGGAAEMLGLSLADAEAAIGHLGLGETNLKAARTAHDSVRQTRLPGIPATD